MSPVTLADALRFVRTAADSECASDTREAFRQIRDEINRLHDAQQRDREAIVRAIKHYTLDPDRCDMQDREEDVADTVLRALRGEKLEQE